MAQIKGFNESIPSRVFQEYTQGTRTYSPPTTEGVIDASAISTTNPHLIQLNWGTFKQKVFAVGSATAGAITTITALLGVPEAPNIYVLPGRQLTFAVSGGAYGGPNGLVLQGIDCDGLANVGNFVVDNEVSTMGGGQTYTNFVMRVIITMYSVVNTSAGNVTVFAHGALYNVPSPTAT